MRWRILILILSVVSDAYKIMVIFPLKGKSHAILGRAVVKNLLETGHEVTYITPFKDIDDHPSLRIVDVSSSEQKATHELFNLEAILNKTAEPFDIHYVMNLVVKCLQSTISHKEVQKLVYDPKEYFDALIIEWLFSSELLSGFSAVFNCPFVWLSSFDTHWKILSIIDEGTNPAYTADMMSKNIYPFTFTQRLQELWFQIQGLHKQYFINILEEELYHKYFAPAIISRKNVIPYYLEVRLNASLVLGISHASLGHPIRLPQNYKQIAGYHIDPDIKPLPEDLKILMDHSKNGVIYFSMGTVLKSQTLPHEDQQKILKMFGELKQTVLWKFEGNLQNIPKNVYFLKWAPQHSILAHPKCKIFITHGGHLSTTESIHFGIPIIGIPVLGDHFGNVGKAVQKGYAKMVSLSHNIADDMKIAIYEILSNPKYADKAKEWSFIYHDRPMSPGKELVYWVEHVIRTKGAPHLRSPALNMPWYQKIYLDLAAIILIIIIILNMLVKKLLKIIFGRMQKSNSKKKN